MLLPNASRAVVDIEKITLYCLNPEHPRGKHKARKFAAALGISLHNANLLYETVVNVAHLVDAVATELDEYGQRYVIDFPMRGPAGEAEVRNLWIVRTDEDFARFVTCYVR